MNPTSTLTDRADAGIPADVGAAGVPLRALVRVMRPYQWVKNFLLALPLLLSHQWQLPGRVFNVALAFVAFSLCASFGYVLNDLRDAEDDRHHPVKRHRPFAARQLSRGTGYVLAPALLAVAFGLSVPLLPHKFTAMLAAYVVVTLTYSMWLKQKLLLDVFVLAGLYTLRVLAGGAAIWINVTPWLLAFCIFFFLSLAFAKRYAELRRIQASDDKVVRGRGYQIEDLEILENVGPTSGYMAVLVMALYINSEMAVQQYRWPFLLWFVCPLILYWVTRVWFLAKRRVLSEDPLLFALKDRMSLALAAAMVLLVVIAWGWPGHPAAAVP